MEIKRSVDGRLMPGVAGVEGVPAAVRNHGKEMREAGVHVQQAQEPLRAEQPRDEAGRWR